MKTFYVYILTNKNHTRFYTGVTSNLIQRIYQHKSEWNAKSHTYKYAKIKLIYYEIHQDQEQSFAREKQIKKSFIPYKKQLINSTNPNWNDLYDSIV